MSGAEATWTGVSDAPAYYGRPILEPAPWKSYIGLYFFTGGLSGASSLLGAIARLGSRDTLAKHAQRWALAALVPSPILLVADLGRPERFANMLRVIKPTSPMSVGSWLLAGYAPVATASALLAGVRRRGALLAAVDVTSGVIGACLTTYTAVLLSDTAIPVWREARDELPFLFAASAAASSGAAVSLTAPVRASGPGRVLAAAGALAETGIAFAMTKHLGPLSKARRTGRAGVYRHASDVLSILGAVVLLAGRQRKNWRRVGALSVLASSVCQRLCVVESGKASALDPTYVLADHPDV